MEDKFDLGNLDPVVFFGPNDNRVEKIVKAFPHLKLVSRGNQIKILGQENDVKRFKDFLEHVKNHFSKYNSLSDDELDALLSGNIEKSKTCAGDCAPIVYTNSGIPIKPRTKNQQLMAQLFEKSDLLFATGAAGTGKTYLAVALAVREFKMQRVRKIILTRPAVEAGEKLGFLPGDMKEKLDPYMQALYDALFDMIPGKKLEDMMESRIIQIVPLAFMRGRTLSDAVVILDEAQNATISQIKMFLTRMGENSKFIITGDETQIDIPDKTNSGLCHAKQILKNIKGISFVDFKHDDVVRHRLVKDIIKAYEKKPRAPRKAKEDTQSLEKN